MVMQTPTRIYNLDGRPLNSCIVQADTVESMLDRWRRRVTLKAEDLRAANNNNSNTPLAILHLNLSQVRGYTTEGLNAIMAFLRTLQHRGLILRSVKIANVSDQTHVVDWMALIIRYGNRYLETLHLTNVVFHPCILDVIQRWTPYLKSLVMECTTREDPGVQVPAENSTSDEEGEQRLASVTPTNNVREANFLGESILQRNAGYRSEERLQEETRLRRLMAQEAVGQQNHSGRRIRGRRPAHSRAWSRVSPEPQPSVVAIRSHPTTDLSSTTTTSAATSTSPASPVVASCRSAGASSGASVPPTAAGTEAVAAAKAMSHRMTMRYLTTRPAVASWMTRATGTTRRIISTPFALNKNHRWKNCTKLSLHLVTFTTMRDVHGLCHLLQTTHTCHDVRLTECTFPNAEAFDVFVSQGLETNAFVKRLNLSRINNNGEGRAVATPLWVTMIPSNTRAVRTTASHAQTFIRSICRLLERNATLEKLHLWGNHLDDDAIFLLARAIKRNKALLRLSLPGNDIHDEGALSLMGAIVAQGKLQELDLTENQVNVPLFQGLVTVNTSSAPMTLNLSSRGQNTSGMIPLTKHESSPLDRKQPQQEQCLYGSLLQRSLPSPLLGSTSITPAVSTPLFPSHMTTLILNHNQLRDDAAVLLADLLKTNPPHLMTVAVTDNCIGVRGGVALADALRTNTHLQHFDMSRNHHCSLKISQAFLDTVTYYNFTLLQLYLDAGVPASVVEEQQQQQQNHDAEWQMMSAVRSKYHFRVRQTYGIQVSKIQEQVRLNQKGRFFLQRDTKFSEGIWAHVMGGCCGTDAQNRRVLAMSATDASQLDLANDTPIAHEQQATLLNQISLLYYFVSNKPELFQRL